MPARSRKPLTEPDAGPLFSGASSETAAQANGSRIFAAKGLGWRPVALMAGLVATGLWGAWVTKAVIDQPALPPIVKLQLSGIVGDYVQAQARSATPPDQVSVQTQAFMGEIERNLKARGDKGQLVLVGEAVLGGHVTDITAEVRREIFARVPMPAPAQASQQNVMGAMQAALVAPQAGSSVSGSGVPAAPPLGQTGPIDGQSR